MRGWYRVNVTSVVSVGGRYSTRREMVPIGGKISTVNQNGRLPVGLTVWVQQGLLCVCLCCTWGPFGIKLKDSRVWTCEPNVEKFSKQCRKKRKPADTIEDDRFLAVSTRSVSPVTFVLTWPGVRGRCGVLWPRPQPMMSSVWTERKNWSGCVSARPWWWW